jgi:hypothetical protein
MKESVNKMKTWFHGALVVAVCSSPLVAGDCLRYGGAPSQVLKGTLVSHQGLRSWWGVKLDHPICMLKDPIDPYGMAYSDVDELQLIFMNQDSYGRYENLLNRSVSVSGSLMGRTTGYHNTSVLIVVDDVASLDGASSRAVKATAKPARPPLPDVESYFASLTVLPKPTSRVIEQAWDKDPVNFFADSDRYTEHMFNGPMNIMWVKCRDGYRIERPTSSTNSGVFQMAPRNSTNPFWGVAVSDSERTNITVHCIKAQ